MLTNGSVHDHVFNLMPLPSGSPSDGRSMCPVTSSHTPDWEIKEWEFGRERGDTVYGVN